MASHSDAIGYLNDLSKEVGEPWFKMVCDLATTSGASTLDQLTLNTLLALYTKKASPLDIRLTSACATASATTTTADFLEELSGFTNFKLLGGTLQIGLKKRITLIFGANGSGKSSLCESLKVLANPEQPSRPLHNVRGKATAVPAFGYKFKSDSVAQTWTQMVGYGPRRATVKYFDTGIAIKNVKVAIEPGRVIVLTPFKLHVFERAKDMATIFRDVLQQKRQENAAKLVQALVEIRKEFVKYGGRPLSVIDEKTLAVLEDQIKVGEEFVEQDLLTEKQAAATELEKAASEEGLKLLRAEHRDLEAFLASLGTLLDSAGNLWALGAVSKAKTLAEKQAEQEVLAKTLIPTGKTLESLLTLLRAASPLCKLEEAANHSCPLCRRDLGIPEVELFKQYYELLAGEIERDVIVLKADIAKAEAFALAVGKVNRKEWDKSVTLQAEVLLSAKTASDLIVASSGVTVDPTEEAWAALVSLRALSISWSQHLASKAKAIEIATAGREELAKQLIILRTELEPLEYAQSIRQWLQKLIKTQEMVAEAAFLEGALPALIITTSRITAPGFAILRRPTQRVG